jgi:SAM-dependent methyltransferase
MQWVKCNLCGADDYVILYKKGRFNMPVQNVICKKCGLVYINPRMSDRDYKKFYASTLYRKLYTKKEKPDIAYEKEEIYRIEKIFCYLKCKLDKLGVKEGKVLEVGCNIGYLLYLFKQRGWRCIGIEPSKNFSQYGKKKYGIKIINGFLENVKIKEKFDLIVLLQVLEHFLDVNKALKILRNHLKPDGLLYIELPNIRKPYSNLSFFFQNAHPFTFSPNTLQSILEKNGFKVILSDSSNVFLRVLAKKSDILKKVSVKGDNYNEIIWVLKIYNVKRVFVIAYDESLKAFFKIISSLFGEEYSKKLFNFLRGIKTRILEK